MNGQAAWRAPAQANGQAVPHVLNGTGPMGIIPEASVRWRNRTPETVANVPLPLQDEEDIRNFLGAEISPLLLTEGKQAAGSRGELSPTEVRTPSLFGSGPSAGDVCVGGFRRADVACALPCFPPSAGGAAAGPDPLGARGRRPRRRVPI